MATRPDSKGQATVLAQQLIAGTGKHLSSTTQVNLAGSSFTSAEITAKLQSLVTLRANVDAAKASTKEMLATEAAQMPALRTLMSAYVAHIKAAYVGSPGVLADFGISLKSRAPLTVEDKAAAVAKRAATREARHTMGPQQKKGIKGAVKGVLVTPIPDAAPIAAAPSSPRRPPRTAAAPRLHRRHRLPPRRAWERRRRRRRTPPRQGRVTAAEGREGEGRSRERPSPGPLSWRASAS